MEGNKLTVITTNEKRPDVTDKTPEGEKTVLTTKDLKIKTINMEGMRTTPPDGEFISSHRLEHFQAKRAAEKAAAEAVKEPAPVEAVVEVKPPAKKRTPAKRKPAAKKKTTAKGK